MTNPATDAILAADDELISAFGDGRVDEYFALLAPEATFLFHNSPIPLGSRAAYRALWDRWVSEDGFAVRSCTASNQSVQLLGPAAAVLSHDLVTELTTNDGEATIAERETIVYVQRDGRWLVVHEHLSLAP
jgi:uncharacterized protein (TIGR02246 family)